MNDDLEEKKEEGDDEEFIEKLIRWTEENKKWTKGQEERITAYVSPYAEKLDVGPLLVEAAECCTPDRRKKWQRKWGEAAKRVMSHRQYEKTRKGQAAGVMPLRRVYDPPGPPGPGGVEAPRTYTVQHIPFSSADVCNWRNQNPSFEENPAKIIKLFEGIFKTYNPTFDDVQYLMDALLTTEETRRIHVEARVHMRAQGTPDPDIITGYPDSTPNWNYQTTEGQKTLTTYRQNVLNGMRRAARKPTNFVKVREVVQGNEEAPGAYLERLKEAYRQYTPVDPDEAANALIVKAAFVAQAAPDVRRKIQKHEGSWDRPGPAALGSREPMVKIQTGNQTIPFMVDTGAAHSVLPMPVSKPTKQTINIIGATGKSQRAPFLQSVACCLGGQVVQHKFLYIPECPIPLLGRDLLSKLQAQISFQPTGEVTMTTGQTGELSLEVPLREHWRLMMVKEEEGTIPEDLLQEVNPGVWAESNPPGMAKNIPPVIVKPKPFANPVAVNQYPIPRRAAEGVWIHLERLLRHGILRQCQSQWNTPLLPVKKEDGTYRPVQDLRLVNQAVETLHPNVPNPYTLLSLIPPTACYFTVLDLKDAFFCCRLAEESQPLFAFQWMDPGTGTKVQYTWTRLPQGFKNSPTLFGVALASDLSSFPTSPHRVLLQYVDDLLLACSDEDTCMKATKDLLNHLAEAGYRVSKKKAQICQPTVKYLGFDISHQQRTLREERKQAIIQIPEPKNRRELRGFLGSAGFCRIWIPDFSTIAKPLHESTRGTEKDPFVWGEEQRQAFKDLKRALQQAPALGIPNPEKPFSLFVDEDRGTAKGVLCQKLGSWQQPVAYLSERLTPTEQGLPPCMRAVVAVATLLNKADKFTFGQDTVCVTPHAVPALLDMKGTYFLSQAKMRKCQMLLLHPRLKFQVTTALNPATLLPVGEGEEQTHDCIEVMDEVYSSRPDLKDEADPHWLSWFVDGSSFVEAGQRKAGYAVVALDDQVVEAKSLPPGTSAQLAELTALTRALSLAKDQKINIYTDSKYAFLTLHAHGALWKERGLLTSRGNQVAHPQALLNLLDAVWEPEAVAVIHCYGRTTGPGEVARGNRLADKVAKEAARELAPAPIIGALIPEEILSTADKPAYTKQERDTADAQELTLTNEGWYLTPDDRIWIPESLSRQITQRYHESTHMGPDATTKQLAKCFYIAHLYQLAAQVSRKCLLCQKNNPRTGPLAPPGVQHSGTAPMEDLVVDFTELPRCGLYRYLLVAVCTYTGWVEAWPTKTEKAIDVTRCLLKEIIPRYGLPRSIGSDNGPAFVHAVLQGLAKALQINWKLHTAYRPQSSGKVERMNRTLKNQLSKLTQETGSNWVAMLPLALLRVRSLPSKRTHLSPFEVLFGRPVPYVRMLNPYVSQDVQLNNYVQSLSRVLSYLNRWTQARTPCVLTEPLHQFEPGDEVWVKDWQRAPLQPCWRGPYTVLLSTPTAVKVAGITPWVHHTRVKKAISDWTVTPDPENSLRLTISRRLADDRSADITPEADISTHS
uniref:uncharacterized protein LOC114584662 n=1 Tax=Podarcis muralis TaxID=64176 RepID=UPI00109F2463|nr:uncharacterized protein LOC114584662 [Podarcis muralis]